MISDLAFKFFYTRRQRLIVISNATMAIRTLILSRYYMGLPYLKGKIYLNINFDFQRVQIRTLFLVMVLLETIFWEQYHRLGMAIENIAKNSFSRNEITVSNVHQWWRYLVPAFQFYIYRSTEFFRSFLLYIFFNLLLR